MKIVKCVLFGVAWGCVWLVAAGVVLALTDVDLFQLFMANYPMQAAGAVAVGIACMLPAWIRSIRRLRPFWRFVIHAAVGLGVFFPVALFLGWIPYWPQYPWITALEILASLGIFFGIWLVFFLVNRREARRINNRVQELRRKRAQGTRQ